MNIALSGYYGQDNFGDEAILKVLLDKFPAAKVISPKTFPFKTILKSDILISGGGSLLQDATSISSLLYYSFIIFTALLLRKKAVIFAQGIGPLNSFLSRFIVKNLLKHCTLVSVRDEKSAQLLESWGIKSELVCDPFFALKIPCVQKTGTVGVQLRSFKGVDEEFLHRLAGAILRSFPDRKFEIYSLENRIDLEVCKKFSTLLPDSKVIPFVSVDETTEKIAHLEYMIAMRFHAILACIRTDVKTLAINYDIKVEKIAREYDLPLIEITDTELDEKFALLHDQQPRTLTEKLNWDVFKMCF